jgi:hypothetical protein
VELEHHAPATATSARTIVLPWWFLVLVVVAIGIVWWRLRSRTSQDAHGWDDPFPPAT